MVGRTPVLPIPSIPGHPADPVGAPQAPAGFVTDQLLQPPSPHLHLPLMHGYGNCQMLAQVLCVMLHEMGLDSTLYSLHSLRRHCGLQSGNAEQTSWIVVFRQFLGLCDLYMRPTVPCCICLGWVPGSHLVLHLNLAFTAHLQGYHVTRIL